MLDTNNSAYPMIVKIADDLKYLIIVAIMVEYGTYQQSYYKV